ncbi:MAG: CPBP family intramembrane glutamic endopeptidase [Woeseiaceae bacterium]
MQRLRWVFLNDDSELRTGWRVVAMAVLLGAAIVALNLAWRAVGLPSQRDATEWMFLAFAALIVAAAAAVVLLLLRLIEKRGCDAVWLPFDRSAIRMTILGTLLGVVPICLLVGIAVVVGYGEVRWADPTMAMALHILLPSLLATFVLAAWEELVLRGYLLRQFALGLNPIAAIIITGVLFGLMHSGNPGANPAGLLYTAIGGILMAWLVFRFGSLWLMIGYHFAWNATGASIFGLEVSGIDEQAGLFVTKLSGADWQTGGSYGFEASLPAVICELFVLSVVLFTNRNYALRSVP